MSATPIIVPGMAMGRNARKSTSLPLIPRRRTTIHEISTENAATAVDAATPISSELPSAVSVSGSVKKAMWFAHEAWLAAASDGGIIQGIRLVQASIASGTTVASRKYTPTNASATHFQGPSRDSRGRKFLPVTVTKRQHGRASSRGRGG